MKLFDIYTVLLHSGKGQLSGNAAGNGVILYGRVGSEIKELPAMLRDKYEADVEQGGYRLFTFDIYAIQLSEASDAVCYATEGRIAVLCDRFQKEYEITALSCKLFYNRIREMQSREANLVLGCYFIKSDSGAYQIRPALSARRSCFRVSEGDKEQMLKGLLMPDKMESLPSGTFPRKLGNECSLLAGRATPTPAFFKVISSGDFVFQQSLRDFYNMLKYDNLCETRTDWSISKELSEYLQYSEYKSKVNRTNTCLSPTPMPKIYAELMESLSQSTSVLEKTKDTYLNTEHQEFVSVLDTMIDRVYEFLTENERSKEYGKSGRTFVKLILRSIVSNSDVELRYLESDIDTIMDDEDLDEILSTLFFARENNGLHKLLTDNAISYNRYTTLIAFIWVVLGIRSKFTSLVSSGTSLVSILYMMFATPYALTFIAPDIEVSALDKLACFSGTANNVQLSAPLRAIAYLHSLLVAPMSGGVFVDRGLLNIESGYHLSKKEYGVYTETGSLLDVNQCRISSIVLGKYVDNTLIHGDTRLLYNGECVISICSNPDTTLEYYLNSGMGIKLEKNGRQYLIDYTNAKKLVFCFDRLQSVALEDDEAYDGLLESYETASGIKLEPEQAEAANLLRYSSSCLIGAAGSGKTTTLSYLIHCLVNGSELGESDIMLLAPTGRAAKRMSECTGYCAKTIHSGLKLYGKSGTTYKEIDDFLYKVVIFDEASMISLNLLYSALTRIPKKVKLIFVGDIAQLPPIDCGKPLDDMLHFMPHVCLSTIKRAAETSGIVKSCRSLLSGETNINSSLDVRVIPCVDDDSFVSSVIDFCKAHLGGVLAADDVVSNPDGSPLVTAPANIQVVTPVNKGSYSWGTVYLNTALHDVFNPRQRGQMRIYYKDSAGNEIEFREGDRVLNSVNNYEAIHYSYSGKDTFIRSNTGVGVWNGDIGTIVGIYDASSLNFLMEDSSGKLVPDTISLKMTESSQYTTKVLVMVEFTNAEGKKFLVAYIGLLEGVFKSGVRLTSSYDLSNLSLAYAITVHKMQGSQADIVIAPLFRCKARGFITRNLCYTAWSRAKKGLYIIGDVKSTNSQLSDAVEIEALNSRLSLFDL